MSVFKHMGTMAELSDSIDRQLRTEEVLKLSRELIRIPSQYTKEHDISTFVSEKLESWGLCAKLVPVKGHGPCVVSEIPGRKGEAIVLNGHLDTVEVAEGWIHDPFGAKVEKGMLYGLGSLDMKCGVAAMMLAFKAIADSGIAGLSTLRFQGVTGEEDLGIGTRTLIKRGHFRDAKAVIVGEGFGGLNAVTIGRRGGSYYDIVVKGEAAHGSQPERGVNAISDAAKIVTAIDRMRLARSRGLMADSFKPLTESQTVLRIQGGGISLTVPSECTIRVMRATIPGGKVDASDEFRSVVDKLGLRSKATISLLKTEGDLYHPYLTRHNQPLVRVIVANAHRLTGRKPMLVVGVSEADDNIIAKETGLPVVSFGPGESGRLARYHQSEEGISISQLGTAAMIYCLSALELAGARSFARGVGR